jgi:hypothetical protein
MTTRATIGGEQSRGSLRGSKYALPSNSILSAPEPSFGRSHITQALIDGFAVISGLFFFCSVAASIPVAIFLMIFCSF